MGNYFDKKKLLEENKDLYISQYDQNLDVGSLSRIIDAKKKYKQAEESGDEATMLAANKEANSIRQGAGKYSGGDDGSEYKKAYEDYEINRPPKYKSDYDDKISKEVGKMSNYEKFSYNPEEDPLFQSYRQIYLMLGDDAYERALSQNALRTGGTVSTGAQSAAMQAKSEYNSMLASKIPELYELAYGRYRDGIADVHDRIDTLGSLDKEQYSRYRDTVDDFENDREYFYGVDEDINNYLYDVYSDESDLEYKLLKDSAEEKHKNEEFAYEQERDRVQDDKWNQEFNYEKERDKIADGQWNAEFEHEKSKSFNDNYVAKLNAAVNLAQALYGRIPINSGVINSLMAMLK